MTSTIDRTKPLHNDERGWFNIKKNFNAAADDIDALQAASGGAGGGTLSIIGQLLGVDLSNATNVPITMSLPAGASYIIDSTYMINRSGASQDYGSGYIYDQPSQQGNQLANFSVYLQNPNSIMLSTTQQSVFVTADTLYFTVTNGPSGGPNLVDVVILGFALPTS